MLLFIVAATLFFSAALLFSVQPLFGKLLLPGFGGSPAVWAVALCFYQAALLGGYAYAHLLDKIRLRTVVLPCHCLLLIAAAATLPFGPPELPAATSSDPQSWLLMSLATGIGLPFLALAANAPLLQAWFAQSPAGGSRNPFALYAASNAGSLLALLSYPFLIEPSLTLPTQATAWAACFYVLGVMVLACGVVTAGKDGKADRDGAGSGTPISGIPLKHRAGWIVLSFVPSGLLVAFTSHITTDIASAPFLWVLPLAVYLGTFILTFRDRPSLLPPQTLRAAQPLAVLASLTAFAGLGGGSAWLTLLIVSGFASFSITSMVCHRLLFEGRPGAVHLTDFYLYVSLGGVLGGVFAALIAPALFNALYEYPLLLLLGLACGHWRGGSNFEPRKIIAMLKGPAALLSAVLVVSVVVPHEAMKPPFGGILVLGAIALAGFGMVARKGQPPVMLAYALTAGLSLVLLPSGLSEGKSFRSFFGVHRVLDVDEGRLRVLMHGTTIHGLQRLFHADGKPIDPPAPAAYYHAKGPLARGVGLSRQLALQRGQSFSVGIVGLGAGSLACYSSAGEQWRFFEIDPLVVQIARDPRHFTFLERCRRDADIVLGDARLTLRTVPYGSLSYLVLDAFSSDSVPAHLLTREAIELYLAKLSPDGLLALHVSNRHMDLKGVSLSTALSIKGVSGVLVADHSPEGDDASASEVLFLAKNEEALTAIRQLPGAQPAVAPRVRPWTDAYSDVLSAVWRFYFH